MRKATFEDYTERVCDVLSFVHAHLDDNLSISELADIACMSPFHFQRVFVRVAGENCGHMVRRLKLERAAWRLQNTTDKIGDIAFHAGFESQEAFARAFRSAHGNAAVEYRAAEWLSFHLMTANGAHFTPDGQPTFKPLARRGEGVPFRIEEVAPFSVAYRLHEGPTHQAEKSMRALVDEVKSHGFQSLRDPMYSFAPRLAPGIPIADVKCYVAVPTDFGPHLEIKELGKGTHLIADHVGSGLGLGDFWFRIWAEALPASGRRQREAPCFQTLRFGVDPEDPWKMHTTVYVPIEPDRGTRTGA